MHRWLKVAQPDNFALHALDGEVVVLEDDMLIIEAFRGRRKQAYAFNLRWTVVSVSGGSGVTPVSVRSFGHTLQIGRYAHQGNVSRFMTEFAQLAPCKVAMARA
ncbi:DUF2244 domain-containing protein [Caballeronia sp. RCC_10]|jgi:uncharacterized membrane protein|uniref:DUF2244 domain-containing protein n=1 Tax=Caballeronia sp. RCC_10 TaxID=3239227 RepID=UPI003526490E